MRRIAVALAVPAALLLAACGSSSSASSTPSSTSVAPMDDGLESNSPVPAGLSCSDIGGVFEVHYSDGRGTCVPADKRPHCHVAPADQDGNYVPEFTLTPPFANGTVGAAQVSAMLTGASNADCWKAPAH